MQPETKKQIINVMLGFVIVSILTGIYSLFEGPLLNFLSKYPKETRPSLLLRLLYSIYLLLGICLYISIQKCNSYKKILENKEELIEELGVNWNKYFKTRCLECERPLTYSSKEGDSSILYCSKCDKKHPLKKDGHLLTEQQAINIIKEMYPDFFMLT